MTCDPVCEGYRKLCRRDLSEERDWQILKAMKKDIFKNRLTLITLIGMHLALLRYCLVGTKARSLHGRSELWVSSHTGP